MTAWNNWYHVSGHTYGSWLPGDPRGWRESGHKKHVAGDYKHPPPAGSGDGMHVHAKSVLKQPPVRLDSSQRPVVGQAFIEMLVQQQIELLAFALDAIHFHLLGRFECCQIRPLIGRAKKHSYFELRERGYVSRLWGAGVSVVPIKDRKHQANVFHYIAGHKTKGAWTWTFREGLYWHGAPGGGM